MQGLISDNDYSFIIEECNSRLKEKPENTPSEFSQQLSKILSVRNKADPNTLKDFSIGEENPAGLKSSLVEQKMQEEIKEKEEILKTLKEKDEHEHDHEHHKEGEEPFSVIEKENDPKKELINKIIEVDHDEPEENVDDYFSKLEQALD